MTFKKGISGNPAGKTTGNAKIEPLRKALLAHVPSIIDFLLIAAKAGDIQASKLLLERVFPALKPCEQTIAIPLPNASLDAKGAAVLKAISTGKISVVTGNILMNSLLTQAKLVEQGDLLGRIESLEALMLGRNEQ